MQSPRIPGFNQADIEKENEEIRDEFDSEIPILGPQGEGVEVVDEVENPLEPPADQRGYRNLNE